MKKVYLLIILITFYIPASARKITIPFEYSTIQQGINQSSDGDTVLVSPGTYYENLVIDHKEITLASLFLTTSNYSYIYNTVIDGNSSGRVIYIIHGAVNVTGFTIRNGLTDEFGGGLLCHHGYPVIDHNIIEYNSAENGGGLHIPYYAGRTQIITNNIIKDNTATNLGGGARLPIYGVVAFENNLIVYNNAVRGGGVHSGGFDNYYFSNTIAYNTATEYGGGVADGGYFINSIVAFNSAPVDSQIEGGVKGEYSNIMGDVHWSYEVDYPYNVGNINVDPKFRDPLNYDFHLQDSINCGDPGYSPCINAGAPFLSDSLLGCYWGLGGAQCDMGVWGGNMYATSIDIGMLPDTIPTIIAAGDTMIYAGTLLNLTLETDTIDVWIKLRLPNNSLYGPIKRWNNLSVGNIKRRVWDTTFQPIPTNAPLGDYKYIAYCGDFPNMIDSTYFDMTVVAPLNTALMTNSWEASGWGEFSSTYEEPSEVLPVERAILTCYPNPFNISANISLTTYEAADLKLEVYNLLGQKIETIYEGSIPAGNHLFNWDASATSSGIYFFLLNANDYNMSKRVVLIK
ncbi:MAG: T9SS type A sorting domain-containing protein [candidate division Zixibacteria bacterium]|nr:T9SS type A sorting domain-containing protein [candidate division Zixibacteria bacterium]